MSRDRGAAPTIAVIICAYTEARWDELVRAVESVAEQSLAPDAIIVVIDHNPPLFERARARFPALVVLENDQQSGLSGARNTGIAATQADYIAFLDDDAAAERDWLHHLVQPMRDPRVLGVGGYIVPQWAAQAPDWFPAEFLWVVGCSQLGLPTRTAEIRNLVGASMLIRRTVFDTVGGFRSEMGRVGAIPLGCEETELCIRARQQMPGSVFMYEPRAVVHHHVPAQRARWSYFRSRCYAEGISKALVSQLVGSKDGLSTERAYVLKTLPRGVLLGLKDSVTHLNTAGIRRALAITAGLGITGLGYLRGRSQRRADSQPMPAPAVTAGSAPRPQQILMVSARYFPLMGGTEAHVYEVARRLAADGADVTVLTTDPGGALPREEVINGVKIKRVKAYPANRDYYFAPELYPLITRGGWDVVHVQGYHTLVAPLAMLASWRARIPYVVTFHSGGHSSQARNAGRPLQWRLLKPLLNHAAQLIGVSQFEADFFADTLGFDRSRFVVIPNGSHLPALTRIVEQPPYPLIVSPGRLERYKGHQRVIAALPKVLERRPDVRLRIAGTGPYEPELHTLVRDLGVSDHVEIGSIPPGNREGMAELYSNANLVTLMSEYEAHPVAVMEALSLKRPVLVADTSGLHELAHKGWVRAVPLDTTPDDLATAIIDELEHPHPPGDISLPTWDDCARQLLAVYQKVSRQRLA